MPTYFTDGKNAEADNYTSKHTINDLMSKAMAYDHIMAAETAKPWSITEMTAMMHFANGFIKGWTERPADEPLIDHWVTFDDDIDIQFWTYDPDDPDADDKIHATGYRVTDRPEIGDSRYDDEVKLV